MPVGNPIMGIIIAKMIGMSQGNALLFAVLSAIFSYIAVPAAMQMTVPEANPSLYVSMAVTIKHERNPVSPDNRVSLCSQIIKDCNNP